MDIKTLGEDIRGWKPLTWESMPDIELYMDQVITYLRRQLALFQGESDSSLVTPSMINNYVKDGIVPRPVNKRYDREQLSSLMMACVLKRVLPMQDIKLLLHPGDREDYAAFCEHLQSALQAEADLLQQREGESLQEMAMDYSLRAAASCLIADRLLSLAKEEKEAATPAK